MQQPTTPSTSGAISPQQERTERSGHWHCRRGVKSSLRREPDEPGDLLRARFGNMTMPPEKRESTGLGIIDAIEAEAELFAVAEQIDLAEKAFHGALTRRNEAQIAYSREPSIMTREALEVAKTAEAVALEILNAEIRWLACTRATTVMGLKRKAVKVGKLAASIVEDILQL
jgi:hypothetical protein